MKVTPYSKSIYLRHFNKFSYGNISYHHMCQVLNDALYHKYGHKLKLINLYEEREVLNQYESLVNVSETSDRTRSKSTIKIESKQDMRILLIPAEVLLLYAGDSDQSVDLFQQQFNVTLTLLQTASLLDVGLDNTNLHFRVQGTNQNISELKNCINSIFRETQEVQRVFKSRNNLEDNGGRKNFDKTKNNNMTCKRPRLESSQNLNKSSEDDKKYNTKIGDDSAETNQLLKCLMKKLKCCNDITSCCPSSLAQELLQCHKILSVSVLGVGDIFFKLVGAPSHLTKLISGVLKISWFCNTDHFPFIVYLMIFIYVDLVVDIFILNRDLMQRGLKIHHNVRHKWASKKLMYHSPRTVNICICSLVVVRCSTRDLCLLECQYYFEELKPIKKTEERNSLALYVV